MEDLQKPASMYLKAGLLVVIGVTAAVLVAASNPSVQTAFLLLLMVWSFCRAYYFAFYVIQRYIDPSFKFSGLISAVRYLAASSKLRR